MRYCVVFQDVISDCQLVTSDWRIKKNKNTIYTKNPLKTSEKWVSPTKIIGIVLIIFPPVHSKCKTIFHQLSSRTNSHYSRTPWDLKAFIGSGAFDIRQAYAERLWGLMNGGHYAVLQPWMERGACCVWGLR